MVELTPEEKNLLFYPASVAKFQRQSRERKKRIIKMRPKIAGNIALGVAGAAVNAYVESRADNDGKRNFRDYTNGAFEMLDVFKDSSADDVYCYSLNASAQISSVAKTVKQPISETKPSPRESASDGTTNSAETSAVGSVIDEMSDAELNDWLKDLSGNQ